MSRLTHSAGGFLRSLQMSSAGFFAFVEGGIDRTFYERLLSISIDAAIIKYQVIAVREIPGSAGGKIALLQLFKLLRQRRQLSAVAFGKRMICAFFADKDGDDALGKKLRSPHLFYTSTYDLEGHLYNCGDLRRALADACGLTFQQASELILEQSAWLKLMVQNWKGWIILCLISQFKKVNCGCTYDRISDVNPNPLAGPDNARLEFYKSALIHATKISTEEFDALYLRFEKIVDSKIKKGNPLAYFKGKWLGHLLQKHIEGMPRVPDAATNSAGEKVVVALIAQVAVGDGCRCCSPYREDIKKLVLR